MEMIEGCDCKVKRTRLVRIVDWLCGALLIGITVWVACRYAALPDKIPTHFGADGVVDGYGGKSMIWGLLAIMWVLVIVISVAELFPRHWNVPLKVTRENYSLMMTLTWHFISTTKLLVAILFAYVVIMCMRGENLAAMFMPIVLTVFFANSLFVLGHSTVLEPKIKISDNPAILKKTSRGRIMTEQAIRRIVETYHRKAMREPTKRLRAAIEQASKKRCWYNGWKHEGQLADYGILHEPMRVFLSEAQFGDICAMCDFLLKKANAQIEKSNDDGDCAGQARFWMEKLLKALMKSEANLGEKIGWVEDFQKRDGYSLADFANTMFDKKNTLTKEDWSRLADMKIAKFKNVPKVEADYKSDDDVFSWLDDKESVEEIEAALRNAGREDEITAFRKSIQGRFGNAAFVAEAALADGQALEAEELFKKSLEHDPTSTTTQARLRGFALAHGNLLEAAAYDAESFFDNPTVAKYDQLMAICTVIGLADVVRKEVFRALETGVRPDFTETKTADWPLPLVASRRSLVEEPQPDFDLLSELLWREHCPADALSFYKQAAEQRKRTGELRVYGTNRQVWDVDWLMADRIAPIWPDEAIAIWERIIQDSPDSWQGDYDNIVRALRNMKPILFAAGKAKEFRARVHGLIDGNKRRRNLVEALEGVLSDVSDEL